MYSRYVAPWSFIVDDFGNETLSYVFVDGDIEFPYFL